MKIRLIEDWLIESKEDIQRFIDKFGQDIYDRLQRNKQRILSKTKDPKTVDITWLVKNSTLDGIEKILSISEEVRLDIEGKPIPKPTNTKELVYNKDGVKVYKVYDVEDMIEIGRDTGWCIAGKYETSDTKVSQANHYFNEYKDQLNLDCYYVFVKGNEKYCVLLLSNGNTSIWNKQDRKISLEEFTDIVGGAVKALGLKDWSKEVFVWDGKSTVPNNVVNVEVADGVEVIGVDEFSDCTNLTSIVIPNSVTRIGSFAFKGCVSLTSISIPDGVTRIGEEAFSDCYSLTSITIPNSVTRIGICAFDGCVGLMSVTIGNSVISIGNGAFEACTGIASITIPNSVTSIGESAFNSCESLTSVTIPNSITRIGYAAFHYCNGLKDVYYSGTEEQWEGIFVGDKNEALLNANIHFNS